MIQSVSERIKDALGYMPTIDQQELISRISTFIGNYFSPDHRDDTLIIKGYAGTGKTSMVAALVKILPKIGLKAVLLAPTGRAAKVLAGYSGHQAFTIHKKIYRQKSATANGLGSFALDNNKHQRTIFIVDEASMISNDQSENSIFGSGRLLDDLFEYVYRGEMCKLILVGDTAQLPPVGLAISPALDAKVIGEMGFNVSEFEMKQVVRQTRESGILHNATLLRQSLAENLQGYPPLTTTGFADVRRITGGELIEEIENCYDEFGIGNTMVLCRSNKRANKYNEGIRRTILYRDEEISKGDLLMVVKNNYFWLGDEEKETTPFIANGDIAEITRIGKYRELYGFRFADVDLRLVDYPEIEIQTKIMLDTLTSESPSLTWDENQRLFEAVMADYAEIGNKRERVKKVKENPYFNALQVKFSYAITCHKAQGGQWQAVFIDQGWLTDDMLNTEFLRWLYTAFTRPTVRLYLVNFKDEFFK
ncbi:MAG: AAA family ATPase [Salinivirgaceae bacterium]|nr:AAA family ATPase [Salinivirgaceae bacterium]